MENQSCRPRQGAVVIARLYRELDAVTRDLLAEPGSTRMQESAVVRRRAKRWIDELFVNGCLNSLERNACISFVDGWFEWLPS